MQKPKMKEFTLAILLAMLLAAVPFAVKASTGYILINTATAPSTPGQQVAAGGNVSLYFGGVTWSGGQFYLLLSKDGFSQVSTGDIKYTPTFDVANLTDSTFVSTYRDPATGGVWLVGNNWVNGTIKKDIAGGNYFIKAFDGTATSVAVTDTYITVIGAFEVVPTSGPGGASIQLKGYAFPANALVNLSYFNPNLGQWISIVNLTAADELGQFTYGMSAPDLMQALPSGLQPVASDTITFKAVVNATGASYTADYAEYKRGIMQVGTVLATAGNLYGNNTDFTATVSVSVNSSLRIAGNWFYPGDISFLWDGVTSVGTTTANGTGFFNTTITIPMAGVGKHDIIIRDANIAFNISISVRTTLILSPTKGPVGTVVTATGYGFPASTTTTKYNVTITWGGYTTKNVAWALTDSSGMFTATFTVPNDYGGSHTVTATANDTAPTSGSATFTVTPTLTVTPSTFKNDGSLVTASATGLDPEGAYTPNIDNVYFGANNGWEYTTPVWPNATGNIVITFIAAGFRPGLHVFALYPEAYTPPYAPAVYALFNVTAEGDYIGDILLGINGTVVAINGTVATISTTLGTVTASLSSINATVVAIQSGMAIISTTLGTINTTLSSINARVVAIDGTVATISTTLGTVTTSLSSISAKIDSVSGTVATISTSIGTVTSTLSSINAKVTEISGDTATIKTDLGTLTGKVTSIDGNVATIKTDVGTVKMDISDLKTDVTGTKDAVSGITLPVWIAVILSLIAAIASIYAVVSIRRKIAG
jgi:archaellum component FlaC